MTNAPLQPVNLTQANAKLRQWRRQHAGLATRQALFRDRVLEWVVESMRFENEPVTMARLRELLANQKTTRPAA
ncbi:MAG: hypothetical protein OJF47_003624 [Nitrospira sp.]|nr:MAG: hypothetical protein OJF47_003624 [Nitrospira sp.]